MNRLTLGIAALAAKSDFGKAEIIGHYHNEGLYYIHSHIDQSRKADVSQVKRLIIEFFETIPAGTLGNRAKHKQRDLAEMVLEQINLDDISRSFVWKAHPDLTPATNRSVSALLKLLEGFIDPDMTPAKAKAQIEQWQRTLERKTLASQERIILGGAGSVARYSLAYWLLKDPRPDPSPGTARKCRDKVEIGAGARDIMGAVMGGLIGGGLGGPSGAVVGVLVGGQLASAA